MKHDYQSINCYAESVCGDSFLCETHSRGAILVHSDGMGHGVKANVLSELTCEIVMSEWTGIESLQKVMKTLALRLPICAVRGLGFSTFTLIDYDKRNEKALIVEYENPPTAIIRGGEMLTTAWDSVRVEWKAERREVLVAELSAKPGDRVFVVSDGVTQSGMGTETMPFGWGNKAFHAFLLSLMSTRGAALPSELNDRILNRALENESYYPHDDISSLNLLF